MEAIKKIDELISPNNSEFEMSRISLGGVWSSKHNLKSSLNYQTSLPFGIHIGAGFADLVVKSTTLGDCQFQGAVVNLLVCPQYFDEEFVTTVGKGFGFSGGFYISDEAQQLLPEISELLNSLPENEPYIASRPIPHEIALKLCSPIEDWYQGTAKRLAQEARAYEYIAVLSQALSSGFIEEKKHRPYAYRARDIIEADVMNIPSLSQIAQQSAINVRSLTQAFRETFGCSIHDYITKRRMNEAIRLLEEGVSVSETARCVGFSAPHFSGKFREHFGYKPSDVFSVRKHRKS